jgi:hypothetical protein
VAAKYPSFNFQIDDKSD